MAAVAIVLRGDRGLELNLEEAGSYPQLLRSSFGAIEDWNLRSQIFLKNTVRVAIVLRGDRGLERLLNLSKKGPRTRTFVAIVLRGDRGLELAETDA